MYETANNPNNNVPIPIGTNQHLKDYIEAIRSDDSGRIKQASEKLSKYILERVNEAITELYKNDRSLIDKKMYEVTICGRLAIYLQERFFDFKNYCIDIEYYRLTVLREDVADLNSQRIRCDILLHSRRKYEDVVDNLLAIEVKLSVNPDKGESDIRRLEEFVKPKTKNTPENAIHSTLVGLFIMLDSNGYSTVLLSSQGYIPMENPLGFNTIQTNDTLNTDSNDKND